MDISLNTSLSGMNAAQLRMDNTAHNVANVNTQGFRPQRVEQVETTRESTLVGRDTFELGTQAYNAGRAEPDLARDMTNMVTDKNTYAANAEIARMRNDVIGTTIDLVG